MIFAAFLIGVAVLLGGHMVYMWRRLLDQPKDDSRYELTSGDWNEED